MQTQRPTDFGQASDAPARSAPTAIVYCEGNFGKIDGKTANGLVRHSEKYRIVSVIDSDHDGRDSGQILGHIANHIPVHCDLGSALGDEIGPAATAGAASTVARKQWEDGEELEDLLRLPPEQLLLRWMNYHLEASGSKKRVKNFGSDLKDCEAYITVLSQLDPGCSKSALRQPNHLERAAYVVGQGSRLGAEFTIKPARAEQNPSTSPSATERSFPK